MPLKGHLCVPPLPISLTPPSSLNHLVKHLSASDHLWFSSLTFNLLTSDLLCATSPLVCLTVCVGTLPWICCSVCVSIILLNKQQQQKNL